MFAGDEEPPDSIHVAALCCETGFPKLEIFDTAITISVSGAAQALVYQLTLTANRKHRPEGNALTRRWSNLVNR